MRQILAILLISALTITTAVAQEMKQWTLEQCIQHALEHNISLKRQELATATSQKDFTQSKLNALPNLNGAVEHNLGTGRVLDRGTYEWVNTDVSQGDLGVQSNLTLFQGLTGWNNIRMRKAAFQMAQAEEEVLENTITLQVMTAYLDFLRKMDLYDVALDKVKVTELQVERMQKLVDVGNASTGELLEVKAQHSTEKYNLALARNSMNLAELELVQLMNLRGEEEFRIDRPDIADPGLIALPSADEVYQNALAELPQIESAEMNIEYSKKNLAVTRGQLSPELFVRGLYYTNYSDALVNPVNPDRDYLIPDQLKNNQYRQVTLGVNVPIFNRWQTRTEISKAKIGVQDAEYMLQDTRLELMKEIQQYYSDAVGALENYNAASETYANSEEAYRYAEEKFRVGMATALELEEARNRKYESRSQMITTKYVYVFYTGILDFYQGKGVQLP